MTTLRTIHLTVQYDGTAFSGWQRQLGTRTVEGVLREAVREMVHHPVTLYGSSRTDAGVHARGLPVAFDTERAIPVHGFLKGLNSKLPPDASVISVDERPTGWRPRHAAVAKTYRYRYQLGIARRPLVAQRSWHVRRPSLDLESMRDAAARLVGEHDFAAFRSAHCDAATTRRRMYALTLSEPDDDAVVTLEIIGNAFLRHMVRIFAGTLFQVGAGKRAPSSVDELLAHGDRTRAGVTAPGRGLTLVQVHFEGYPRLAGPPADPAKRRLDAARGDC